jgi:hypothetical protein
MKRLKFLFAFLAIVTCSIVFAQQVSCQSCTGTGKETKYPPYECQNCKPWNSEYRRKVACHVCKDTRVNPNKTTWKETCSYCKGSGRDYKQEARNKEFGTQDYIILTSIYSGRIPNKNIEFRSLELDYRIPGKSGMGGQSIKNKWKGSEYTNACSCLGSEWRLPNINELLEISNYIDINGLRNEKKYNIYGDFIDNNIYYYSSTFDTQYKHNIKMINPYNGLQESNQPDEGYFNHTYGVMCVKNTNYTTNDNQNNIVLSQNGVVNSAEEIWIHSKGNFKRTTNRNNLGETIWLEDGGRFTYYEFRKTNFIPGPYVLYRKDESDVILEIYDTYIIYKNKNNPNGIRIYNGQWQK